MRTYTITVLVGEDKFLSINVRHDLSKLESDLTTDQISDNVKMVLLNNLNNILNSKVEREVVY